MVSRFPNAPTATPDQSEINIFCNAAKSGDRAKVIEMLDLYGSAIINERDNLQDTALTWAAWTGQKDMCALLLERGAEIDKPGMNGRTAIGWAANGSRSEAVEFLMEKGANTELKDSNGQSPADLAASHGNNDLAAFIRENGVAKRKQAAEAALRQKAEEEGRTLTSQRLDALKKHKPPKLKL